MNRLIAPVAAAVMTLALVGVPSPGSGAGPSAQEPTTTAQTNGDSRWRIQSTENGTELTWTRKARFPVTDDRPRILRNGVDLGPTVVRGRHVSVLLKKAPADLTGLDVVLSGRSLVTGRVLSRAAGALVDLPVGPTFGVDPGVRGPYPVAPGTDYHLDPMKMPGFPSLLPVQGHVVAPVGGPANAPLVLFLHGRHQPCYGGGEDMWEPPTPGVEWTCAGDSQPVPSALGYVYAQRLLASQGYTTVSIDANAINAMDWAVYDGGAQARGRLIRRHLSAWAGWVADGASDVDMSRVVVIGHSRGGEGANRAAELALGSDPFRVVGQVLVGPTNFARQSAATTPTVTMLPGCDGDVSDLQGQSFTDVAATVTRAPAAHSSVLVPGANHNFFNTEWTPALSIGGSFDDGSWVEGCARGDVGRLTAVQQRAVGRAYFASAVAWFTGTTPGVERVFDGTLGHLGSAGEHPVRTHAVGGDRQRRSPLKSEPIATGGTTAVLCRGIAGWAFRTVRCADRTLPVPHWPNPWEQMWRRPVAEEISWDVPGGTGGYRFRTPMDLSQSEALDLRMVVSNSGGVRVDVRVTDTSGASATVRPVNGRWIPALTRRDRPTAGGVWGQAVRIDPARLSGIDLSSVASVELVAVSERGRLWLLDAHAVDGPDLRLGNPMPTVSLGHLRLLEGSTSGSVALLPYTVEGTLTSTARLSIGIVDASSWQANRATMLEVPAGTTSGTVQVRYDGNLLDDYPVRLFLVEARPVWGLMPTRHLGTVAIRDDDPTPRLRSRLVENPVREGDVAVVKVRLDEPVAYPVWVLVKTRVPATGRTLRYRDIPRWWLRRYVGVDPDSFHQPFRAWLGIEVVPGQRIGTLRIPIRADRRREGREAIEMVVRSYQPRLKKVLRLVVTDH